MRYNLGLMDKYPIEAAGSNIENNPMFRVTFKKVIDPIQLEAAVYAALDVYPLFKTKVKFKKEYYLETNDNPITLIQAKEEDRPLVFGNTTNDYPWQICYYQNKLTFEWLHGLSDGVGAYHFLRNIICNYCNVKDEKTGKKFLVATGLEPFFDNNEKGIDFKNDPAGFNFKYFNKIKNRGYKTDFYCLQTSIEEVKNLSKVCETSFAPIITVLYSQAIRKHLPTNIKNRNVACNVVLDLRRPLKYETMHNCVEYKRCTYVDEYDKMNFKSVAMIYKDKLDKARLVPNVVKIITDRVKLLTLFNNIKNKKVLKFLVKISGNILKDLDCNFVVTYLGRISFPEEVVDLVENVDFKVWHDFGESIISCCDYNGKFNVNISENFVEKGVVEDFIALAKDLGIKFVLKEKSVYEQAHFEE